MRKNYNKINKCPHCGTKEVIKFGFYKGHQRYRCKNNDCGKIFTKQTQNPFRHSKKFKENLDKYYELFQKGLTIRQCAEKLNITIVTSFFWRHRILYDLKYINYVEKLSNYAELTRVVITENFKGDRSKIGKEKDKISIVNGINKDIEIISIVAARNHLGITQLRENIAPRIDKRAYAVAFLDGRLQAFSDKHNEINKITVKKYDIEPVDKIYSIKVKKWLKRFYGVATKYIDHYLSWRAYEYKKNFEYDYRLNKEKIIDLQMNLKARITTYISWRNIKAKALTV